MQPLKYSLIHQVSRHVYIFNKDIRVVQTFSSIPNTISYNLDKTSELVEGAYVRAFKACNLRAWTEAPKWISVESLPQHEKKNPYCNI